MADQNRLARKDLYEDIHKRIMQSSDKMQKKKKVLIIGAGVIGLTTAYMLIKHGHHVTVLSEKYACPESSSNITSEVAAGAWQVPLSIYRWKDKDVENKIKSWSLKSYQMYSKFATSKETGVYLRNYYYVYRKKINNMPKTKAFMNLHKHFPGFCHSHQILQEKGFGPDLLDCFTYQAPTIDTDVFLKWLKEQCFSLGVTFSHGSVQGRLRDNSEALIKKYQVDLVINCTGLQARELAEDPDVYPLIGAAFILQSPHGDIPDFAMDCTTPWYDEEVDVFGGHVLIVPKGKDKLWLGTVKIRHETLKLTHDQSIIQRMVKECIAIYPPLEGIIAGKHMTFKTAARPVRKGSPRVEQDPACQSLIHNYGQGPVGYILSWGCAEDVLRIVDGVQLLTSRL